MTSSRPEDQSEFSRQIKYRGLNRDWEVAIATLDIAATQLSIQISE